MRPTLPQIVRLSVLSLLCLSVVPMAQAEELRGETFCYPAKDAAKIIESLRAVEATRRTVVDVSLSPRFIIKDGGVWPDRFYLAQDEQVVTDLEFSKETGAVPAFNAAVLAKPETDICIDDPTRADRPADDEGLYFEMGLSPEFHNRSGTYELVELKSGAKDAKKFYQKMIPTAVRMLMPATDYMAVKYDARQTPPQIFARVGDQDILLTPEVHKDMWVVSLEDIEELDASLMIVRGGPHAVQPVPSPKTMRRFGWGQKDQDDS